MLVKVQEFLEFDQHTYTSTHISLYNRAHTLSLENAQMFIHLFFNQSENFIHPLSYVEGKMCTATNSVS